MISPSLAALLCCPRCRASLRDNADDEQSELDCPSCGATYAVAAGIPDLTHPDIENDEQWETWRKHLDAFQQRREHRQDAPDRLANRMSVSGNPQQVAFAAFAGIRDGVVLDIGCGPGKFHKHLPSDVHYVGLDPIPLPDLEEVDFIRGLAEHIPLVDDSVQHITVLSALDHFRDTAAFVQEARRVLSEDGRLHVVQQVHESNWSLRGAGHWLKDQLEDRLTKHDDEVPHHMTEFDREHLRSTLESGFKIEDDEFFSASRFSPRRQFLSLSAR